MAEGQKLPMVTKQEFMKDKKVNYKTYAILVYFSNFQDLHDNTEEGFEGVYDDDRYIYENKILKNKEAIEEMSKTKINTFIRTSKKIAKITNGEMVGVRKLEKSGKVVFDLYKGNTFVKIEEDILRAMCNSLSSNAIKIYCFFKWRLRDKGDIVTRKEIARNIGLSEKSCDSLNIITDCTKTLNKMGLIKKEIVKLDSKEDNEYNYRNYYELVDYETWKKNWKED